MRMVAVLALWAVVGAACGVVDGDEEDVMAVWDLRETRSVEAVGWPEDMGSMFEARSDEGLERILLAGGVVVEGTFRVNPARRGGIGDEPYADVLRFLGVTFEREPVDAVVERARGYAEQLGVGLGEIPGWAAHNRDEMDLSPGGATARSEETMLPGGGVGHLSTRAFTNGGAVLRLSVSWPKVDEDTS